MWAYIAALTAAVCWGLAPIAAKVALFHVSPVVGMTIRSVFAACLVLGWLAASGQHRMMVVIDLRSLTWMIVEALLATVVGDALYFYALQRGEASQVGLIMASSPLITLAAANVMLGEPLGTTKILGAILVFGGLILVSL